MPKSMPKSMKKRCRFRDLRFRVFYRKPNVKIVFLHHYGGRKSIKNRSKIDQKMESKMECILASIFERCSWILGAKLGGRFEEKSIKNRIEKTMQKTKPFGTRLGPSSGCQGGRDVLRPNPTGPGAPKILSRGAARAAALRAKILKLKRNSS